MCTRDYKSYSDEFNNDHINSDIWKLVNDSIKKDNEFTLLIGAGVTSCLVGNWDELLNELAILRGVSDDVDIKPQELRDYLSCNCDGCFFPKDMNVLEKGEYLRYSPTDQIVFNQEKNEAKWREKVFADRVLSVINRLIYRHLCDGAGAHVVDSSNIHNYKKDFMNWCRNTMETPFQLERRTLCKNKDVEDKLERFSTEEMIEILNSWYGISIDCVLLQTLISSDTDVTDPICEMFSNLFDGKPIKSFRKQVNNILNCKELTGKPIEDKIKIFLKKIAAYFLWRPGYSTLETLLILCIYGKIKRVITYNFDTIFDRLLNDPDVQKLLKEKYKLEGTSPEPPELKVSVYGIGKDMPYKLDGFDSSEYPDVLPIIHVHGIVDGDLPETEGVIFSETSYFSYQQFLLNPGGTKLAEACRRGCVLSVGFSGVDPNFRSVVRQIIHQKNAPVFSDRENNPVFLTRSLEEVLKYYCINENMPTSDYDAAFLCANTYLNMLQHYYQKAVGVEVLWAKDFDELSDNLKETFGIMKK